MSDYPQPWTRTIAAARDAGIPIADDSPPVTHAFPGPDCELHYVDWGASADRPAIIYIHGFLQQARTWDFTCLALRDRFACYSLDLRGHGDSGKPPEPDYSTHHYLADLQAFVEHLRATYGIDTFSICGLSLGGQLAYVYASQHPADVDSIVVVDVAPELNREARRGVRRFIDALPRDGTFEALVERVAELSPLRTKTAVRGSLERSVDIDQHGNWRWKHDARLFDHHRVSFQPDELWSALAAVNVPTLFVLGRNSRMVAAETVARMVDAVPGSSVAFVPDASHRVPGDNPIGFLSVVQPWWEGHLLHP